MKHLIFISCGQRTPQEKKLGKKIKRLIDSTPGFEAFYAKIANSLTALTDEIFSALKRCSGLVVILHPRERVAKQRRSSVWLNQEVMALAFRQYLETTNIPTISFKSQGVILEGAMQYLLINPRPLKKEKNCLEAVHTWLTSNNFQQTPYGMNDIAKIEYYLTYAHWTKKRIAHKDVWICDKENDFRITSGDSEQDGFREPWTDWLPDKVNNSRYPVYLKKGDVTLEELSFVTCDGGRIDVPLPERDYKGNGKSVFFYVSDSLRYKVGKIVGSFYTHKSLDGFANGANIEIR